MGSFKWDILVEKEESVLCNQSWNGINLRYPLPKHINSNRNAYGDLSRASDPILYGVPNENVCVNRLLNITQMVY